MLKFKLFISILMTAVLLTSMFSSVVVLNAFADASGTQIIHNPIVASEWDIRTALECGIDSDGNVYALNQCYKAASVAYNVDYGVDLNKCNWELKFTLDNPSTTDSDIYFLAGIGDMVIAIRNFNDGTDFKVGHASTNWGAFASESQMCTDPKIVSTALIEGTDISSKLSLFESSYRVVKIDNEIYFYCINTIIKYNDAISFDASGFDFNAKKVFAVNNQYQNIGFVYKKMLQSSGTNIYPGITGIEMYTIPLDGHTHSYVSDVTKAASCTEKGLIKYICICGVGYTEDIPALVHDYVSGYCSRCGEKDPDATFFSVTAKGSNGNTVTAEVVSGAEITLADIAPFAYGYEVIGWTDSDGNPITSDTITVTSDLVLIPIFEIGDSYKSLTVSVSGASNTEGGVYKYNDSVVLVFNQNTLNEGEYFGGWVNEATGTVISYSTTYKFYVGSSVSIAALVVTEKPAAVPVVAITDYGDISGDGSRWSFLMERTVLDGYTYVGSGFILNCAELDLSSDANVRIVSQSASESGQFRLTVNLKNASQLYITAYLTYMDSSGNETTVYSNGSLPIYCQKPSE